MKPGVSLQVTVCFPMALPQADMASKVSSEVWGILGREHQEWGETTLGLPDHLQQLHHRDRVEEVQPAAPVQAGHILKV